VTESRSIGPKAPAGAGRRRRRRRRRRRKKSTGRP